MDAPKSQEDLSKLRDQGESTPGIDDAAAEALEALNQKGKMPVELDTLLRPMNWRILVIPKKPPETIGDAGLITVTKSDQESEEYLTHLGRIIAMGPLAFTARTQGGVHLAEDPNIPKVGDWVLFPHHGGIRFRTRDKQMVVLLTDIEVLAVTDRPEDFMFYL